MNGLASAHRRLRDLVDFLLPAACLGCDGRLPLEASDALVCAACLTRLSTVSHPRCGRCGMPRGTGSGPVLTCVECTEWPNELAWARSRYVLRPPADALVHALKYGGWADLAEPMGVRMADLRVPGAGPSASLVVPVPTTRRRQRSRGYNQARLLGGIFARERGLRLFDALVRHGVGITQVALHPTQRRANVENAFRVRAGAASAVAGRTVVLVDDVLTTGATAGAAARTLQAAGARTVGVVTFARALPFRLVETEAR